MSGVKKSERNRVVVRFKDGRVLKGYTYDFTPLRQTFHLKSGRGKDKEDTLEIRVADLKALFFVRTLEGNRDYDEKSRFDEVENPRLRGLKIKVEFSDGETMSGTSQGYSKKRKGFFIFPVDPQSNNERIYVLADALHDAKVGAAAEKEEVVVKTLDVDKSSEQPREAAIEEGPTAVRSYLEITGGEKDRVIELREKEIFIGRSPKCGVRLPAKTVSRKHARLSLRNGEYYIEDLGSVNATYVNGKKVAKCVLRNNDQIGIGKMKMLFYEGSAKRAKSEAPEEVLM